MVRNLAPVKMETTFYDERTYGHLGNNANLKRSLTLDLHARPSKRSRLNNVMTESSVFLSPDINKLKLGSPELMKMIIDQNQNSTVTPTPTTHASQIMFTQQPTAAQEMYAQGFVEALNDLRHSNGSQGNMALQPVELETGTPGCGGTYTNLDQLPGNCYSYGDPGLVIKDEPQTVPSVNSSPPLSPIDMDNQEKIKLERKRQRNRVAASKCRRRKLERISRLEDKVKMLKGENMELSGVVMKLREHVSMLKEQVMDHARNGCNIMPKNAF